MKSAYLLVAVSLLSACGGSTTPASFEELLSYFEENEEVFDLAVLTPPEGVPASGRTVYTGVATLLEADGGSVLEAEDYTYGALGEARIEIDFGDDDVQLRANSFYEVADGDIVAGSVGDPIAGTISGNASLLSIGTTTGFGMSTSGDLTDVDGSDRSYSIDVVGLLYGPTAETVGAVGEGTVTRDGIDGSAALLVIAD